MTESAVVLCSYLCSPLDNLTTSFRSQPHNMQTMIQPPSGWECFFSEIKILDDQGAVKAFTLFATDARHAAEHHAAMLNKTCQKQQYMSQNILRGHQVLTANQQKQSLMQDMQEQQQQLQDFLALIATSHLHSQQGFFPASFWHHPRVQPPGSKMDFKKQDHLPTPVSNSIMW